MSLGTGCCRWVMNLVKPLFLRAVRSASAAAVDQLDSLAREHTLLTRHRAVGVWLRTRAVRVCLDSGTYDWIGLSRTWLIW